MTSKRPWITSLSAALLSACASGPARLPEPSTDAPDAAASPPVLSLALQGQLNIKLQAFQDQDAKGINLGFFFNGTQNTGQLDLMTPMGSQVAQVRWTQAGAWVRDTQGEHYFATLGDLSEQVLGERLPLASLMHWVRGLPDPALPLATQTTDQSFDQSGWHIDTQEVAIGRLNAQRPATQHQRGITMRVRLDR
ncbi:MAG: hypothetical protein KGL90_01775 [Burkholderiales bacterium]|nr:hypothetical protein [Burkholderiales bacterium]